MRLLRFRIVRASTFLLLLPAILIQSNGAASQNQPNTPIEHFIVLMQENHTFDNYFGTFPGADGFPEGLCIPENPFEASTNECVEPFHIGDLPVENLDHSRRTFRI